MENGEWEVHYFEEISSTQKYLLERIEKDNLNYYCVWSEYQTNGIGTKNNKWIGEKGNLFFSFIVDTNEFEFVPMQSLSVYFSFLLYKELKNYKKNLLIKWPNDIYMLKDGLKKIAGVLVNIKYKKIICGIGVNTKHPVRLNDKYKAGSLELDIKNGKILKSFLNSVSKKPEWGYIFMEYKKIFEKSRKYFNINGKLNNDATLKAVKQWQK